MVGCPRNSSSRSRSPVADRRGVDTGEGSTASAGGGGSLQASPSPTRFTISLPYQPPHSILKKPHPASVIGTPRSRSPVQGHRESALAALEGGASSGASSPPSSIQGLPIEDNSHLGPASALSSRRAPHHPSPLRSEAASASMTPTIDGLPSSEPAIALSEADDEAAARTNDSALTQTPGTATSVTFSVPKGPPSTLGTSSIPSQPTPSGFAAPLPSILKPASHSPSRRTSISRDDAPVEPLLTQSTDSESSSTRLHNALLQLPSNSDTPTTSSMKSSNNSISPSPQLRSASPSGVSSSDRTRIVGKGGYGGRQGGPSLNKNRTSSSGGLSDIDMRPGYERKVGFDTMIDADDTPNGYFSFCLQVKSRGYKRTKNTRTFMCCVDDNHYSERALEWLMESLVSDGDEIVALRVLEGDPDTIDQDGARDDARELMASIVQLNDECGDRSVSIVVEFVAGRVTSTILGLIYMYRPDSLTVGTKGRSVSAFHKMLGGSFMGSCSRDILNRSPVPVVIVRPEAKVMKHLTKRQNDPKRRSYHDLVALSKEDHLPLSIGQRRHSYIPTARIRHPHRHSHHQDGKGL